MNTKVPMPIYLMPGDYLFLCTQEPGGYLDRNYEPDDPDSPDIYKRPCFTQADYERRKQHGNT